MGIRRRTATTLACACAAVVACSKSQAPSMSDSGWTSTPVPIPPEPLSAAAPISVAPWAVAYADSDDLPADAGDGRCPAVSGKERAASIRIEIVTRSGPSLELSIPSLALRKRLWDASSPNPDSCGASRDPSGTSLRFGCGEDLTSTSGKIYGRGSDVILGQTRGGPPSQTRFHLPCGTVPRFDPVACPPHCKSNGDGCACSELDRSWGARPAPSH